MTNAGASASQFREPGEREQTGSPARVRSDATVTGIVVLAAILAGVWVYQDFLKHAPQLWWSFSHDRSAHYSQGATLALSLQAGDLGRLRHDLNATGPWGPLHTYLVAGSALLFGTDYRVAVLPSLVGWVLAIVMAFLLGRRMIHPGGVWAGLLAALLVAVSPAHRSFAADIMLESLGAGLSLLVLYAYVCWRQAPRPGTCRLLALSLTLAFLLKYNYWVLLVLGLSCAEVCRQPRLWARRARSTGAAIPAWLRSRLREPVTYPIVILGALAVFLSVHDGFEFPFAGWTVRAHNPHTLINVTFALICLRVGMWWFAEGKAWLVRVRPDLLPLVHAHVVPAIVWLLMPKRLGYLLWYFGPANNDQAGQPRAALLPGREFYWEGFLTEYHPAVVAGVAVAGLALVATLGARLLRTGSTGVIAFACIAVLLTCQHPMQKQRFLHSWVPACWVLAGVGCVVLAVLCARMLRARLLPVVHVAGAAITGLSAVTLAPHFMQPGHSQEGGYRIGTPNRLEFFDSFASRLDTSRSTFVLSNVNSFLWRWRLWERTGRNDPVVMDIREWPAGDAPPLPVLDSWLQAVDADRIVIVHIPPDSPLYEDAGPRCDYRPLLERLRRQNRFRLDDECIFQNGELVSVWSVPGANTVASRRLNGPPALSSR